MVALSGNSPLSSLCHPGFLQAIPDCRDQLDWEDRFWLLFSSPFSAPGTEKPNDVVIKVYASKLTESERWLDVLVFRSTQERWAIFTETTLLKSNSSAWFTRRALPLSTHILRTIRLFKNHIVATNVLQISLSKLACPFSKDFNTAWDQIRSDFGLLFHGSGEFKGQQDPLQVWEKVL